MGEGPKLVIELESGGILKLPAGLMRQLRAPVGTRFAVVPAGDAMLWLFREDEDEPEGLAWSDHCTLAGRIGSFGIADLFGALNMSQKTGVVVFRHGGLHKEVFFDRGEIVFANSNAPEQRLGVVLVKRGLVKQSELDELLARRDGVRLGAKLIQSGLLKAKDLYEAVRHQVEEILYSIFPLTEGTFAFYEGSFLDEDLSQFTLNTQNILMEGYRRLDEWGLMREKIPHDEVILFHKPGDDPHLEGPAAQKVWSLIDGKRTVAGLMKASGLGEFDVTRTLYDLLRRGLIEAVDPKAAVADRGRTLEGLVDGYNKLYVAILKTLDRAGKREVVQRDAVDSFVAGLEERARRVFDGVAFDSETGIGHAAERLVSNLEALSQGARSGVAKIAGLEDLFKRQQLQGALDEVLNYLVFALKNALPPAQADPIIQRIRAAHQRLREAAK